MGEAPSLDNSKTGKNVNTPRNIGFVKVPADMQDKSVLSKGPTETGGFYNFGGGWTKQENKGVNWLTQSKSMENNYSRLKVTKLTNGQILVLFETWTGAKFVSSHIMTVDQDGKITRAPRAAKFSFRVSFSDGIFSTDSNTAVFYTGTAGKLVRYEISLSSGPGSGGSKITTTKAPITTTAVSTKVPFSPKDLGPVQYVAMVFCFVPRHF